MSSFYNSLQHIYIGSARLDKSEFDCSDFEDNLFDAAVRVQFKQDGEKSCENLLAGDNHSALTTVHIKSG